MSDIVYKIKHATTINDAPEIIYEKTETDNISEE